MSDSRQRLNILFSLSFFLGQVPILLYITLVSVFPIPKFPMLMCYFADIAVIIAKYSDTSLTAKVELLYVNQIL